MATWLITGGCGFIGSHLADALLARGDGVRVIDDLSTGKRENLSPACELVVGDVTDPATVARAMEGVDGCWHLAAVASVERSTEAWIECHRVNLTGTIGVLDAARRAGARGRAIPVVYASSAAVYGDGPDLPSTEASPTRPLTAYGADKLGSELHARVAARIHGVPTTGLRFFNVHGPRQDPFSPYSGVISIFARKILDRQPLLIHGDGGQSRDFISVADVIRFLLRAMERTRDGRAQIYNVCTGDKVTIVELARVLFRLCGHEVEMHHGAARPGDIRDSLGDPERAAEALGVRAVWSLERALRLTLDGLTDPTLNLTRFGA
ncbi:MAG: NAD-dependent epimerase/dehydratase family protein [Magnetococcales bacterium]|nr:NAD-dependent epimerase/dehydratase family protein [Magnetococcales bacterium]